MNERDRETKKVAMKICTYICECKSKTICIYTNVSAIWLYKMCIKIKC